jgi:hypothetical protein
VDGATGWKDERILLEAGSVEVAGENRRIRRRGRAAVREMTGQRTVCSVDCFRPMVVEFLHCSCCNSGDLVNRPPPSTEAAGST